MAFTFECVLTVHKIAGDDAEGFADYLTRDSNRGDYYLDGDDPGGDGAGGVWHASPRALAALGLSAERPVSRDELLSLMDGRAPNDGREIRRVGGDGSRVAGIDLTFSPPKSVSALWAACSGQRREQIGRAHRQAVESTLRQIERDVQLLRTRKDGVLRFEHANSLVAAQFMHTSSRLTRGQEREGVPDPQLHSHVVVLAGERIDGRFAAVESRELLRSARMNGAWYRSALAHNLQALGLDVEGQTGKDGRYFEIAGVPSALAERWSERASTIEQAARDFRKRYGRDPKGAELRSLTLATRGTKTTLASGRVDEAWRALAEEHGLNHKRAESLFNDRQQTLGRKELQRQERELSASLLDRATRDRSMISERDLHASAYELSAGVCHPADAKRLVADLERSGELVRLQGGMWTTRQTRELEQQAATTVEQRAQARVAPVSARALKAAEREVEQEIGAPLSKEQRQALQTITGPGGVSALVGQAGTGKGVVLRTASKAWQHDGYKVLGTAVAGATAERLGADADIEKSTTTDKLIASAEHGHTTLDEKTVVIMDEAGMADSKRYAKLIQLSKQSGCKMVSAGDSAQLSSIGAGGLFKEVEKRAPTAQLTEMHRARNEWERKAWREVREGNSARALAAYQARDRLHLADTRQQAINQMVDDWDRQRHNAPEGRTVMLTDASNKELDEINLQAQERRAQQGELGARRAKLKDRPYDLAAGDHVIFTKPLQPDREQRIENGTLGTIQQVTGEHQLTVKTHGAREREVPVNTKDFNDLRLAYAQHVYKAQGLTANQALVLTGGWQTDRERAYVALTRARDQTHIYSSRDDLGHQDLDTDRINRLAENISKSHAQEASISRQARSPDRNPEIERHATDLGIDI